jgi:hypothetical protein
MVDGVGLGGGGLNVVGGERLGGWNDSLGSRLRQAEGSSGSGLGRWVQFVWRSKVAGSSGILCPAVGRVRWQLLAAGGGFVW